jgi:hypothetical protein
MLSAKNVKETDRNENSLNFRVILKGYYINAVDVGWNEQTAN